MSRQPRPPSPCRAPLRRCLPGFTLALDWSGSWAADQAAVSARSSVPAAMQLGSLPPSCCLGQQRRLPPARLASRHLCPMVRASSRPVLSLTCTLYMHGRAGVSCCVVRHSASISQLSSQPPLIHPTACTENDRLGGRTGHAAAAALGKGLLPERGCCHSAPMCALCARCALFYAKEHRPRHF